MEPIVSWIATLATIGAALLTASNLGSRITGTGFAVFTVGSLAWLALGILTDQQALITTNIVMTGVNLFGVWRWLGRQTQVEEGAQAASRASQSSPGEALFPVSLLAKAPLRCGDDQVGTCVDAMAGCQTGQLAYVVVSEGGVAGVGETLRRVPWQCVAVANDEVTAALSAERFASLEEVPRDRWPSR